MLILFATLAVGLAIKAFDRSERKWLWLGYIAHIVGAFVQIWIAISFYYGGDQHNYFVAAQSLHHLFLQDPTEWARPLLSLALGGTPHLPIDVIGVGSSTGVMTGIATWMVILGLNTIYSVCAAFSVIAFTGQLAMYRALREIFPPEQRLRVLATTFFIPSVVFWSSAILKESIALAGLGWCFLGVWRTVFTGNRPIGVVWLLIGGGTVALVKPYVLIPLTVSSAVWFYWARRSQAWTPQALFRNVIYAMLVVFATIYSMQLIGELYPKYSIDYLAEQAAYLQSLYYQIDGNSTYQLGTATQEAQLSNAPLAVISVLFRPFIFEVHNVTSLISGIEMSGIIGLMVVLIWRRGARGTAGVVARSPILIFFIVFVLILGLGIGLGAPNLGSLARYRILLMPFYVLLVLSMVPFGRRRQRGKTPAPS